MLEKLIVFVEEYSMEAALHILLPGMLDGADYQIIRFQCKDDLLKQLPARLKGYSAWMPETWSILVLVDRDDDDCMILKQQLEQYAQEAGLLTKTRARAGERFKVTNRIVIEELESWYFGDWTAVKTAYPRVSGTIPEKAPYRNPDDIQGGTWEALERILNRAGYFSGGLRKADCARQVARYMNIDQNRSLSFNRFYGAVQSIVSGAMA
ncbi:DUF4276 family protein [uncultured Desulfobacter sp.]|uniref:DUF4276 family protein n=1 Tax=uncultured Desulfobacter sp. TaxID=240139 RepID=UPI0029C6DF39|nr:DUF4276 family protein [uncultured Desulfobacter sp.]